MPRTKADTQDAIATFFESVASHMRTNRGIFLGPRELTAAEAKIVEREASKVAQHYRESAIESRSAEE